MNASDFCRPARSIRFSWALFAALALAFAPVPAAHAADDVDLHDIRWFVHIDLVTASRPLSFWQAAMESAVASGNLLLEGAQGPTDTPCCTRLALQSAVQTFGSPGDGLDIIDSAAEQAQFGSLGGSGSRAFLVDSLTWCGGPSNAIGCAQLPTCSGNGNDDPNLWMLVTVTAFDQGTFPGLVVHERGHNTCLGHGSDDDCEIMAPAAYTPGNAGCLSASECTSYRLGRTTPASGQSCACHASPGVLEPDGSICSEPLAGVCSGGACGETSGAAAVQLLASAHPGSASIPAPDDGLRLSALTANWIDQGQIAPTADDIFGLAYAHDAGLVYGIVPTSGDDRLVTIDPASGDLIATVGTIANGSAEMISLAYDPGAGPGAGDDRLLALEIRGGQGWYVAIDPASPNQTTDLGRLPNFSSPQFFTGLAYDSLRDKLYVSSLYNSPNLLEVDLSNCPGSVCSNTEVAGVDVSGDDSSLAFARESGRLYLIGTHAFSGTDSRTFFTEIDPVTGSTAVNLSIEVFTPGGLAAVPEPGLATGLVAGLAGLGLAGRIGRGRDRNSSGGPTRCAGSVDAL